MGEGRGGEGAPRFFLDYTSATRHHRTALSESPQGHLSMFLFSQHTWRWVLASLREPKDWVSCSLGWH